MRAFRCRTAGVRDVLGSRGMHLSTTDSVYGFRIVEHKGLVEGSTVRAKNAAQDLFVQVKQVFGGELDTYTDLLGVRGHIEI